MKVLNFKQGSTLSLHFPTNFLSRSISLPISDTGIPLLQLFRSKALASAVSLALSQTPKPPTLARHPPPRAPLGPHTCWTGAASAAQRRFPLAADALLQSARSHRSLLLCPTGTSSGKPTLISLRSALRLHYHCSAPNVPSLPTTAIFVSYNIPDFTYF